MKNRKVEHVNAAEASVDTSTRQGISVGLGSTGNCNLNCPHCYSKPLRGYTLSFDEIAPLIEKGGIDSINFGTGENILNPDFPDIAQLCRKKGIKMSLTSNGYSVICLPEEELKWFHDIDISLDFPDKNTQNDFRHGESWDFVDKGIEKCRKLGIEFSIATALMNVNYKEIPDILARVAREKCNLRINIFKKVPKAGITQFALTYDEFWDAMKLLFDHGRLISCSEPIVNAMLNIPPIVPKSPCGRKSFRVHPSGAVVPCVYWPESNITISDIAKSFETAWESDIFKQIRVIPQFCLEKCDKVEVCGGGCASRRHLNGKLGEPDEYCPIFHKKAIPDIKVTRAKESKDLVHSSYLCTLIFAGK